MKRYWLNLSDCVLIILLVFSLFFPSNICTQILDAIENEKVVEKTVKIYNVDRAVCGRVAGAVAKKYGDTGFAGQLNITYDANFKELLLVSDVLVNTNFFHLFRFTGSAGQSFACFLTPGMNIRLVGEANDYVGKVFQIFLHRKVDVLSTNETTY